MSRICIPIPSTKVIGVSGAQAMPDVTTISNVSTVNSLESGANALVALPTYDQTANYYPVGSTVFITVSGVPYIYQLVSGTNNHNPPSVVRPTDWGNSQAVWIQRM